MEYIKTDINIVRRAAGTLKTIAHPDRLRIIEILACGDRAVGELVSSLGLGQTQISKHLACLRRAGLVGCRKDGNRRYYSIRNRNILNILDCIRKTCGKGG